MQLVFFFYKGTLLTHGQLDCHVIQRFFCKQYRYLRSDQIRRKLKQKTHWVTQSSLRLMSLVPLPHNGLIFFGLSFAGNEFAETFLYYSSIPGSFNSRWTSAFLTSSLCLQGQSLNSSLLPPSVHFIFHLSSEVVPILSVLASAVLTWPSEEQSALLGSFVLHAPKCNVEVSVQF